MMIRNQATDRRPNNRSQQPFSAKTGSIYSGLIHRIESMAQERGSESITIGVVGCHANAGVTTICANFGLVSSFDLEQDVLIISANPGDSDLAKLLKISPVSGLNDVVLGSAPFEEVVAKSEKGRVSMISSGVKSKESFSPFLISRFPTVLNSAKERFRVVFVDMQPLNKLALSPALLPQLDAVVLVIDGAQTTRDEAQKAQRTIERSGGNLIGCILNRQNG